MRVIRPAHSGVTGRAVCYYAATNPWSGIGAGINLVNDIKVMVSQGLLILLMYAGAVAPWVRSNGRAPGWKIETKISAWRHLHDVLL